MHGQRQMTKNKDLPKFFFFWGGYSICIPKLQSTGLKMKKQQLICLAFRFDLSCKTQGQTPMSSKNDKNLTKNPPRFQLYPLSFWNFFWEELFQLESATLQPEKQSKAAGSKWSVSWPWPDIQGHICTRARWWQWLVKKVADSHLDFAVTSPLLLYQTVNRMMYPNTDIVLMQVCSEQFPNDIYRHGFTVVILIAQYIVPLIVLPTVYTKILVFLR